MHTVDVQNVVAVRRVAALRLRRQLPLRRRRAAGRAARARAVGRSGAAGRAHRRGRAAHAARSRRAGRARARRPAAARASTTRAPTDAVHDLLLRLGDLTPAEIAARSVPGVAAAAIDELVARRARAAGADRPASRASSPSRTPRATATASARRCPPGLPASLLEPAPDAHRRSACAATRARTARSRPPRPPRASALGAAVVEATLQQLAETGRVVEGEFRPGGQRPRVVRRRRAARAAPPLAGGAAQGSRAGRAARARPLPGRLARPDARRAPASTRCSTWSSGCRARRSWPRCSNARCCRRGSSRLRAGAARHARVGRRGDRGWASSRSASATAASRSTSPTSCGCSCRRPRHEGPARSRGAHPGLAHQAAARRSSARCTRPPAAASRRRRWTRLWSLVWKGLVTNDTLHPLRAYAAGPERIAARGARPALPLAPAGAAVGRGPLVGGRATERAGAHGVGGGAHAATAVAPRRGGPRRHGARARAGRLQHDLSGAAAPRGHGPRAPRLLRGGPGRRAVRRAGRRRPAAGRARSRRRAAWPSRWRPPIRPIRTARWSSGRRGAGALAARQPRGRRTRRAGGRLRHRMDRARRSAAAGRGARRGARIARDGAWRWRASWCAWRTAARPNGADGWSPS